MKIKERKGEMLVVSTESDILDMATVPLRVPCQVDELLSPLTYIVPGQLFAYHLAKIKGENPDSPRGLSKVIKTR